jgi:K+-sensing histidine kinase KdpD
MFSETHSDSQRADRILASIRREESRPGRGLLKIFFGMAPGVGKTYAMLEAAIQEALEEQKKGLGYVVDCTIEETELVRPMVNGGTHITEFLVN